VHFVEKVEDQKKRSRMSEGSSNITMNIIFIVSQINYTATALNRATMHIP